MNTTQTPKNPDQRRAWILYQLHLAGSSFADLGRELGVTRNAVRNAIDKRYPKMERAIATKIGKRPEEIWPERYASREKGEHYAMDKIAGNTRQSI
jgi:Ner family transcriptional regulator